MEEGSLSRDLRGKGGVLMGPRAGLIGLPRLAAVAAPYGPSVREDRFLAGFERGIAELALAAAPAWRAEREWAARIRAGLAVLLARLEADPALARMLFVEALAAGPRVLGCRATVLGELTGAIDEGRTGCERSRQIPPLAAEGLVGAAFSLIHARLCEPPSEGSLVELLNPLMALIVLPYRGRGASRREQTLATPGAFDTGCGAVAELAMWRGRGIARGLEVPANGCEREEGL